MSKLTTIRLVTVLISLCGVSSVALANSTAHDNAYRVVNTIQAENTAKVATMDTGFTMKRVRVTKAVSTQSKQSNTTANAYTRKTSVRTIRERQTDKFVQNNSSQNMNTPVYFSENSFGAR